MINWRQLRIKQYQHKGILQQGYTLVEVTIVLAVIAILAELLFPVFASVREKAHQTSCASNLNQIGLTVIMYAQDNDNIFPYGGDPSDIDTDGWAGTPWETEATTLPLVTVPLAPYIKDNQVWDCPDDTGYDEVGASEDTPLAGHPTAYAAFGMSYEYDTYLAFLQETISGVTAWDKYALTRSTARTTSF